MVAPQVHCFDLPHRKYNTGMSIDQDSFRQLLYFQATENGATYHPQPASLTLFTRRCYAHYKATERNSQ